MPVPTGSIRKQIVVDQGQAELWEMARRIAAGNGVGIKDLIFKLLALYMKDKEIREKIHKGS